MKKSVEYTVEKLVNKVINGKYDTKEIGQVWILNEQLSRKCYTQEELKEAAPLFGQYSLKELKEIKKLLKKNLLEEIQNEKLKYLQVVRIIETLNALGAEKQIKASNNKVKFCIKFYRVQSQFLDEKDFYKTITLLD